MTNINIYNDTNEAQSAQTSFYEESLPESYAPATGSTEDSEKARKAQGVSEYVNTMLTRLKASGGSSDEDDESMKEMLLQLLQLLEAVLALTKTGSSDTLAHINLSQGENMSLAALKAKVKKLMEVISEASAHGDDKTIAKNQEINAADKQKITELLSKVFQSLEESPQTAQLIKDSVTSDGAGTFKVQFSGSSSSITIPESELSGDSNLSQESQALVAAIIAPLESK